MAISALTGEGMPSLVHAIETQLFEAFTPVIVRLPYQEGQLISLFHEQGQISSIEHGRGGVLIQGLIPDRLLARFEPYFFSDNQPTET